MSRPTKSIAATKIIFVFVFYVTTLLYRFQYHRNCDKLLKPLHWSILQVLSYFYVFLVYLFYYIIFRDKSKGLQGFRKHWNHCSLIRSSSSAKKSFYLWMIPICMNTSVSVQCRASFLITYLSLSRSICEPFLPYRTLLSESKFWRQENMLVEKLVPVETENLKV